jgi:nucleotide-binding universal stress UspA family protein
MASQILVAMDESAVAEKALEFALEHHPNAEITVLHVVGTPSGMMGKAIGLALSENVQQEAREDANAVLDKARGIAHDHDTKINTDVEFGHPARAIVDKADEFDAVVLGTHGGSLADRLFVGNVADKVFRQSPVPVTVVR